MNHKFTRDPGLTSQRPVYGEMMVGAASVIFLCLISFYYQSESRLNVLEDKVKAIELDYQGQAGRHYGKRRYILMEHSSVVFELFIGKDAGDFKPKLERISSLRAGDRIRVHYSNPDGNEPGNLLTGVTRIERHGQPVFIAGNHKYMILSVCVGMSLIVAGGAYILKRLGKIS